MDFTQSERSLDLAGRLMAFMREFVYPAEEVYARQRREGDPHRLPPVVAELQTEARARGLWNLFPRSPASRWSRPGPRRGISWTRWPGWGAWIIQPLPR
jgi:hypothetical protein